MRTDELRNELHDLAAELEPFAADVTRVRGRVRRTRILTAGAVTLVLLVATAGVVALRGGGGNDISVAEGKDVALDELAARDALVVVGPEDATAVRSELDASNLVDSYVVLRSGVGSAIAPLVERLNFSEPGQCTPDGGFLVDLTDDSDGVAALESLVGRRGDVYSWGDFTDPPEWRDTDAELFMDVDASPSQVQAVAESLAAEPDVEAVHHLTKADALAEFRRMFRDQPELAGPTAESLPESFRVRLADGADLDRFDALDGVSHIVTREFLVQREAQVERVLRTRLEEVGDVEIFMNVDASEDQIAAVRALVEADSDIDTSRFLSKQDAYEEFKRIFAGQPALIESTTADSLPVSIRVVTASGVVLDALANRYGSQPGVNDVVTASMRLCP